MKVSVKDITGKDAGELEVKFAVIDNAIGTQAVHDYVTAYRAAQRLGTHCAKTMGEVAGSGKKPWRQKGTGRARAGSFASPLWRGGGVTHGPRPRDYTKKLNNKVRQLALRKAFSARLKSGDVLVVDNLKLQAPKSKDVLNILRTLGTDDKTNLIVVSDHDNVLNRSSRNIPYVGLTTGKNLNPYDILKFDKLVITKAAFEQVEQRLAK